MSNSRRLINIVLICSLAINLLLVGGLIGRLMAGPPARPLPDHLGWILRQLDEPAREKLRPDLKAHAARIVPLRREMRSAQRDFEAAVSGETVDADAAAEALARLRTSAMAYQESTHQKMVQILATLDSKQRNRVMRYLRDREREERRPTPRPAP
ncbi:MAG: periplasmic heavy metal sensor [Pseudomonadota bacterium]